jgi:hypothetical protein
MSLDRTMDETALALYRAGYIPLGEYLALLPADRARVRAIAQEAAEMQRRDDAAIEEQRRKPKLRLVK